jgi:hypothetical protein
LLFFSKSKASQILSCLAECKPGKVELNFSTDKPDEDDYQIEKAKSPLPQENLWTWSRESVQKNFYHSRHPILLCCREYGLIGGFVFLFLYLLLLFRFVVASHKANTIFGKLVVGLGFPMIFQAMINMAVAVELLCDWTDITVNKQRWKFYLDDLFCPWNYHISVTKRRRNSRGTERCCKRKKH